MIEIHFRNTSHMFGVFFANVFRRLLCGQNQEGSWFVAISWSSKSAMLHLAGIVAARLKAGHLTLSDSYRAGKNISWVSCTINAIPWIRAFSHLLEDVLTGVVMMAVATRSYNTDSVGNVGLIHN